MIHPSRPPNLNNTTSTITLPHVFFLFKFPRCIISSPGLLRNLSSLRLGLRASRSSCLSLTLGRSLPWLLLRRVVDRIFPHSRCTGLSGMFPFIFFIWCRFHTYTIREKNKQISSIKQCQTKIEKTILNP
jgi:hypothetical protein